MTAGKRFALAICLILLSANWAASAQDQTSNYRETYPSVEAGPTATCLIGTIPQGVPLTLITKDQAVSAKPVRDLPDQSSCAGTFTGTLLQPSKRLSTKSAMPAVLAPASSISIIKQEERSDPALVRKIETYVEEMNRKFTIWHQWDHRWLNPRIATRIIGLSQSMSVAQVTVRYDDEVYSPSKGTIETTCIQCAEETITLLAKGNEMYELFDRGYRILCSDIVSAFRISGRIHLWTSANGCTNDIYISQVQDVSGPAPRSVFSSSD